MVRQRSEKAAAKEQLIQHALDGLQSGVYSTVYSAAKAIGVSESSLRLRWNGGQSCSKGNIQRQLLTDSEEKALVQ